MQTTAGEQPTREGLIRAIRRWDLIALAVNAIIGAGIFGLPAEVFRRVGVYSLLAFVVCAAAMTLIVLCLAEVSSRFSDTGGPYLYAREAFGPIVGFQVGWMTWIARLTGFAANCNLLIVYVSFFVPSAGTGLGRATAICLVVVSLTIVNVIGVRNAARVSDAFTVAKLVPLTVFVVIGSFFVDPAAYAPGPLPAFGDFSVAVLLLVYAFTGFEMVALAGGESRNPRFDLPRALLVAIGVVSVFYLAIQAVAIGTLPQLATASRPLSDAAGRFLGNAGATLLATGAVISLAGNLNVIMLVGPRLPFAMAQRRELPAWLATTHPRYHTPHVAIVVTAVMMLALTLSGTFVYAVTVSVIARLLSYGATCAALPVLRRRANAPPAAFLAPAGGAAALVALVLVAWLLSNSTSSEAMAAAIAAAVGMLVYALCGWRHRKRLSSETVSLPFSS
ncbi:MAG TPA: amino acid permease [Vicinamibacterales bacterium]